MREPKIIIRDVYSPLTEAQRHKILTANILKIIKANQDRETVSLSKKEGCDRS